MAAKPNPRQTYKALLLNYDELVAMPDDCCSYCLTSRDVAIMLSFIEYVGWKTRYEPTETEIDQDLIDSWAGNLARRLMSDCGCGGSTRQERLTSDGVIEVSLDGGVTWNPVPPTEDPRQNGSYLPPVETETSEQKCEAANSFVAFMKQKQAEAYQARVDGSTAAALAALLIGFLLAVGVIATGGALAVFLAGLGSVLAATDASAFNAAFTDEVWEDLLCLILCAMDESGTITQNDALAIGAQIAVDHPGIAGNWLKGMITAMGAVGVTNAIRMGLPGTMDCDECACPDSCASAWDGFVIGGIPRGYDLAYGDDWVEFTAYDTYGYIGTPDNTQCCYVNSIEVISGTGVGTAFVGCGENFPDNLHGATPIGTCCWVLEVQGSLNARYRVHMGECP